MSSNGYLVPPSKNPERKELWDETWKRIDRFLPELRKDLALDEPEPEPEPAPEPVPVPEPVAEAEPKESKVPAETADVALVVEEEKKEEATTA